MVRGDDNLAFLKLALNKIEQRRSCYKNIMIVKTGYRVINKEEARLLVGPTFDLEQGKKETPNEDSLFSARQFNGLLRFVRIWVRDKKYYRLNPPLWIVLMQIMRESKLWFVSLQLFADIIFR